MRVTSDGMNKQMRDAAMQQIKTAKEFKKKSDEEWRITKSILAGELQEKLDSASGYKEKSDGSSADYYKLPKDSSELQDLISAKNMNAQIGEIFRECYRYGQASHCDEIRGIKKILFYANAELKRLASQDNS